MDRTVINVSLAVVAAVLLFLAGIWLGGHPSGLPGPLRESLVDDDQAVQAELEDDIEENFHKEIGDDELDDGALRGMVRALDDRFSHYFSPKEAELFRQGVSGEFEGVGLSVEQDRRGLLVSRVFEDSPAERAGIVKGDIVTEVNGESIAGEPTQVATGKIKGEAGTKVTLTVLTPPRRERELEIERERIEVPVADSRSVTRGGRKLGVVELTGFTTGSHGALREEVDKQLEAGAEGLILDLRGNGGGELRESVLVSSIFIEDGRIVSTKGRSRPERIYEAEGDAIPEDIEMVVLVDKGSASASEIVTGALRDRERATVVGQRTFGKGVFQTLEDLQNGGLLSITAGSYYLPSGENISDKGIEPKVAARDNPKTKRDEALPKALRVLLDEVR